MEAAAARVQNQTFSHYRLCTLGETLNHSLQELVDAGDISMEQMASCLLQFDVDMNKQLGNQQDPMHMHLGGSICTYRNAENVWTWDLSSAKMQFAFAEKTVKKADVVEVKNVRVVAIDAFPSRVGSRAGRKKKGALPEVAGAAKVIKQPRKKKMKPEEKE